MNKMLFSQRMKIASEVDAWFAASDKKLFPRKAARDSLNVVTALVELGYVTGCRVNPVLSSVCSRGTRACCVDHKDSAPTEHPTETQES